MNQRMHLPIVFLIAKFMSTITFQGPPSPNEKKRLTQILIDNNYNLSAVAKSMNIARSTLYRTIKKISIE